MGQTSAGWSEQASEPGRGSSNSLQSMYRASPAIAIQPQRKGILKVFGSRAGRHSQAEDAGGDAEEAAAAHEDGDPSEVLPAELTGGQLFLSCMSVPLYSMLGSHQ